MIIYYKYEHHVHDLFPVFYCFSGCIVEEGAWFIWHELLWRDWGSQVQLSRVSQEEHRVREPAQDTDNSLDIVNVILVHVLNHFIL